jgi:hypothetical protein
MHMSRRLLATTACAFGLLLSGCGDESGKGDGTSADLAGDFAGTADALIAKLGAPGQKADMPQAADPAVRAFDEQAGKALTALGTPALPVDGFKTFDSLCGKTAAIVGAWIAAGGSAQGASADPAAQRKNMEANLERYFDQVFTPLLFAAHCSAAHMPFLEGEVEAGDTSKAAAVKQIRDGAFGQATGLMQMAGDPKLEMDRRRRIVDMLAADAPNFALALAPAQRRDAAALATELRGTLPEEARPAADRIRAGFETKACGKICSM